MLTAAMVRMVKGAAASILLLLMTEPAGGNQEWIERYTCYTDKPVSQALAFLMETGMITRSGERGVYTYRLASGAQQLPLPVELLPDDQTVSTETVEETAELAPVHQTDEKIESETFRLDPLASSRSIQNLESRDPPLPDSRACESEFFRLNLQALDEHNIREPARSRLARLAHVTPGTVRYHCGTAKNSGQAIYRIEHNWPAPADWVFEQRDEIDPTPDEPGPELAPVSAETQTAWGFALGQLAGELSRADNETWARSAWPAGMDGGTLVVGANNPIHVAWLEQHVRRRLEELIGCPVRCEVRYDPG